MNQAINFRTVSFEHTISRQLRSFDQQSRKQYHCVHQPHRTLDSAYPEGLRYHSSETWTLSYLNSHIRSAVCSAQSHTSIDRIFLWVSKGFAPFDCSVRSHASIEPTQDNRIVSPWTETFSTIATFLNVSLPMYRHRHTLWYTIRPNYKKGSYLSCVTHSIPVLIVASNNILLSSTTDIRYVHIISTLYHSCTTLPL